MAYWEDNGAYGGSSAGYTEVGSPKKLVPGLYTYSISAAESGTPHNDPTYSTYVQVQVLGNQAQAIFRVGHTQSPAGSGGVWSGQFTIDEDGDLQIVPGSYSGPGAAPLNPLNRTVDFDAFYNVAGSSAGNMDSGLTWIFFEFVLDGDEPPPDPDPEPGIIGGIYDEDLVFIGDLEHVKRWTVRVELKDTGNGVLVMNRYEDDATEAILKQGNFCKITIPIVDPDPIFIWQLENGKTVLADAQKEEGGEDVTWSGRGGLAYLERYKAMARSEVVPAGIIAGGVYIGPASTGGKAGQLLKRFIDEATHAELGLIDWGEVLAPLGLLTHDFDYDDDSDGDAWVVTPSTADLAQGVVGESGLFSATKLIGIGAIDIIMGPDLDLHSYNHYGRDLTSATFAADKVRFERGVNVAQRIERQIGYQLAPTHTMVQGQDDVYGFATSPSAGSRPTVIGFVQTQGDNAAFLEEVGLTDMVEKLRRGEAVSLVVSVGDDELNGQYLPGPPGTNGHFWIGDDVTLHTGSTEYGDLDEVTVRIMALVISTDDANNLTCTVEVMWTRLLGRFASVSGYSNPTTGSPSTGGGVITPAPPSASSIHSHDHGTLAGLTDDDHLQYVRHFVQVGAPGSPRDGDLWVEA